MSSEFIDCRNEVSSVQVPPAHRLCWLAADIRDENWIVPLSELALGEIARIAQFVAANPLQNLQRRVVDFDIPHCQEAMKRMKHILDHGVGIAVLDRLPIDSYSTEQLVEIYWLLGQMIGRPVAQKWNGMMVYDVRDTGVEFGYGVRGSTTNIELVFHTDNAFGCMVPDYVGLLCKNAARTGGISRFCSLYSVHERMRAQHPKLLDRLYQPMFFDRQKEHAEGAPPTSLAPYFSWRGDRLFARANSSLVRKGYDVAGEKPDGLIIEALDAIDDICTSEDLWFEGPLARGHVQYLNNHEVGHYRSAFEDFEEPEQKRHLFRLWHREQGSVTYDGGYPA